MMYDIPFRHGLKVVCRGRKGKTGFFLSETKPHRTQKRQKTAGKRRNRPICRSVCVHSSYCTKLRAKKQGQREARGERQSGQRQKRAKKPAAFSRGQEGFRGRRKQTKGQKKESYPPISTCFPPKKEGGKRKGKERNRLFQNGKRKKQKRRIIQKFTPNGRRSSLFQQKKQAVKKPVEAR